MVVGLAVVAFANLIHSKTWVIPHVLDTSGNISSQPNSFDTQLTFATVTPETATSNTPVSIELYLYDNTGAPMRGLGGAVCNPCMFELLGNQRQLNLTVGDLVNTNGGGFDSAVKLGFGVIVVGGGQEDRVKIEGRIINSLDTTSNLSAFVFTPREIVPGNGSPSTRTFVLPHILEKEGTISTTQFTFDTTIFMTYTPSSGGTTGATASLYLYDDSGNPMQTKTGEAVCNPCQYQLGSAARKQSVRIDDLITAKGSFDTAVKTGFGVIVVGGDDANGVALQSFVVNSHTSPFDLSVFGFEPQPIAASAQRAYVIPHVLETSGTINQANTFDTTIFVTYTGGLASTPDNGGATVNLYLYDNLGQPMRSATSTDVCNPCSFPIGSSGARKQTIALDDLIVSKGGFGGVTKLGFGVLEVTGADPTNVVLQAQIANSHTGPSDLSVFGFEPQPIAAAARTGPPSPKRTFVIPHMLEKSGKFINNTGALDTTLYMTFASPPAAPPGGATMADLYLYNESGDLLRSANNQPVCAPCSYQLNGPNQKLSISIEDLILNAGGFDRSTKLGFGIVVVNGADPDAVNLQGFVVNSHTSAFDLSVFGFQPQEIQAPARILPQVSVSTISNQLVMKWHTNSPGYLVEQSGTFSSNEWSTATSPAIVGREYVVTNTVGATNAFFRLRRP